MTDLLQKAIAEINKLPEPQQDEFAEWILEKLSAVETEDEWEERVVTKAFGDTLNPDGSVDFGKLRARTITSSLEEFYPEGSGSFFDRYSQSQISILA